jgi:Tol biopolymer transport system component
VTARTRNDEPHQVWKIELSNGDVTKLTDTQNDFVSISASADLSQVLLLQMSLSSNLYIAPSDAPDRVRPIAQAYDGVAWTSNGDLVYAPTSSGDADVWLFDPKTGNQRQLTTESSTDGYPAVSPDGRYVVFVSDRAGKFNVWRMNVDGSDVVRLTASDGESHPVFTSDGQFVVFNSVRDGSVWKVPAEGGEPTPISRTRALNISISPDGTEFAYFGRKEEKIKVFVKSFLNDELLHEFDLSEGYSAAGHIVWTRDGRALIYAAEDNNLVGNLWLQSLAGNRPQKLTSYESNEISAFDLSQDGSELAVIRGTWNHSAVLVQGLLK